MHLKIDTGMERIGVHYYNAPGLLERAAECRHTAVEGIYSHFANADAADLASARLQLARFMEVLEWYDKRGVPPPVRHMANSGAILQLPESHLDLVRPGILLYGVYPSDEVRKTIAVRPALSWKSRVVYFKVVTPGHPVSYGSTWQSDHPVRVVTVPVGYGDGYFRALSNRAEVSSAARAIPWWAASAWTRSWSTSSGTAPTTATRWCSWARTAASHHVRGPRRLGRHHPLRDPHQHQHARPPRLRVPPRLKRRRLPAAPPPRGAVHSTR